MVTTIRTAMVVLALSFAGCVDRTYQPTVQPPPTGRTTVARSVRFYPPYSYEAVA